MATLFKKCPSCGKRFEVEHTGESVEKKVDIVDEEKIVSSGSVTGSYANGIPTGPAPNLPTAMVAESIEEDDYTETYKCKHCGYVWTEKHAVVADLGEVGGAGTDQRA